MKTHPPFSLPNIQYTLNSHEGQPWGLAGRLQLAFFKRRKTADSKRVPLPDTPEGEWRVQTHEWM